MALVPQLVKNINPNADSLPSNLTDVNGTLFFTIDDGTNGVELWKSDGTAAGTVLVRNISPNSDSHPTELTVLNGTLYFVADDGVNGTELWQTDGTDVGTVRVSDINGNGGASISGLTIFNNTLYFAADDGTNGIELWKSDGTDAGTTLVSNIRSSAKSSSPKHFIEANGQLFFTANDGRGDALWVTDGTDVGTHKLSDAAPYIEERTNMVEFDGKLYFASQDGKTGRDLWVSDGTPEGTKRLIDFTANDLPRIDVRHLTVFKDHLFFTTSANDTGKELWISDGTAEGTRLFTDIYAGGAKSHSAPRYLTIFNDKLFFKARDRKGFELWVSNGDPNDPNGTYQVKDINGKKASDPADLKVVDGVLYFTATSEHGRELWQTDGTEAGTVRVSDINPGLGDASPDDLTKVGDQLFFTADDGTNGRELWVLGANTPPVDPGDTLDTDAVFGTTTNCFLTGTHILTEQGDVPVESLKIGDRVQSADGTLEPIKWVGKQTIDPSQVRNPLRGYPILIKAGALGNGLPHRDLYTSPDHALLFDGLLINAGALVNGTSILKTEPTEAFVYYHIELDQHLLVVAEGTAAESYLPQQENRDGYDNAAEFDALYPNGGNLILWPLDYPRISSYTTVPRYIRKRLGAISAELGLVEKVA